MASWIDNSLLRTFVKNVNADDEAMISLAVDIACGKVEELCGPIVNTTVTGEVHDVRGSDELCLRYRATSLVSITTEAGTTLTPSDWAVDGQLLRNKAGRCYDEVLVVTYTSGYFNSADSPEVKRAAAPWAFSAALHIGQQHMRTLRRFGQAAEGPVGFLVPAAAMDEMADHLLAPDGFS